MYHLIFLTAQAFDKYLPKQAKSLNMTFLLILDLMAVKN